MSNRTLPSRPELAPPGTPEYFWPFYKGPWVGPLEEVEVEMFTPSWHHAKLLSTYAEQWLVEHGHYGNLYASEAAQEKLNKRIVWHTWALQRTKSRIPSVDEWLADTMEGQP